MSSCLSGGGRAYRLEPLDIEFIKSPSTSSWTSNSSSPSSTLSQSSISISTRKPRTPRKRPNQTYNEAATILSTAHPKIFPTKNLTKFTKSHHDAKIPFFEPSDLLMPFERPHFAKGLNPFEKACLSPGEISSKDVFGEKCEDFDAESILDEEIGQGIDSIMGNSGIENGILNDESNVFSSVQMDTSTCYGYPMGLGFDFGFGIVRNDLRAMRNVDEGNWWSFPSVNVLDLNSKNDKISTEKKKKKVEIKNLEPNRENAISCLEEKKEDLEIVAQTTNVGLLLKLNYDEVLHEWSDKASPFSGDGSGNESTGKDVQARLAQIDLFSENGGIREASVLRYKEKRRTRLFSKKIRYQVRKVNADRRPRIKGRFVRTPNSPED